MINLYNLDINDTGIVQSIDNNYASKDEQLIINKA